MMKKVLKFLEDIRKKDEVIIIFHNDADGICAATILNRFIHRRTEKKALLISQPMPVDANLLEKIKTTVPTKIIITDLAIDQQKDMVRKIAGISETLIIDHHIISNNMNNSKIVHYNPRFTKPKIYQSASYLCYKICGKIDNMEKELWLALVGTIADYNLEDSEDLIKEGKNKYKFKDPKKSVFSEIGNYVFSTKATRELSPEKIADVFFETEDADKLGESKNGKRMLDSNQIIQSEINSITSEAEKNMEKQGEVFFVEVKPKHNVRSPISTIISEKHRKKLVIIYEKTGGKVKVSARNQDKNLNVGKVFDKAMKGIKGSAGGHEAAGGAIVPEKDWEEFKQKIVDAVNK